MKPVLSAAFVFCMSVAFAQAVPAPQPLEEQHHINYWWWVLGVLLALGAGAIIYLLIKKDPKRDAVR